MASLIPKFRNMSGEQFLAAVAMLLIVILTCACLVALAAHPDGAAVLVSVTSGSVTALASLVRRHDTMDSATEVSAPTQQNAP